MYILHIDSQDYSSYRLTNDDESIQLNSPDLIKTLFQGDYVSINNDHTIINLEERSELPIIVGELELYSKYSFKPI